MRGCLVVMLWLVGCYTPTVPTEALCSASGVCPVGQTCIAGTCEAMAAKPQGDAGDAGDAGTSDGSDDGGGVVVGDRDHDGIADEVDNCPDVANAEQFNEDGDALGDACDLCPQLVDTAATATADTDNDRVGDACDPHPGTKDSVWLFEGFHKGIPTAWARSANWTQVGDSMRVTAAGNSQNDGDGLTPQFTSPSGSFDNFTMTMTVLVEARTGSLNDHEFGMAVYTTNNNNDIDCEIDQDPQHSNGILWLFDTSNFEKTQTFPWVNGTQYRLTMTRQGSNYTCSVVTAGGTPLTVSGSTNLVAPTAVDVFAFGLTAQLGSIQLIGTP